jgi:actin
LHERIFDSINACDVDLRKEMYGNVVLSGGNTTFPGFAERLQKELVELARCEVNVVAPPGRKHSARNGGSVFASRADFQQLCISDEEYQENGPSIVHRKCTY